MPNIDITPGSGKTVSTTTVGSSFSAYSTSGEAASGVIYCSANTSTAPTPVTNANPLPVGVQGTVAATQSGTWNVTNISGTVSLPTGAATAAKQPALGTAGSASADVISVQGVAGGVAQPVSGSGTFTTTNATIGSSGSSVPTSATLIGGKVSTNLFGITATNTAPNLYALHCDVRAFGGVVGQTTASLSMPVAIASDQTALPASLNTAAINDGATALTPKFAAISASSSGNNTVVAAVTSKKIRVLGYRFSANGTVAAKWRSSTAGDISGLSYLVQYASAGASFSPVGHFETASGEGLQLNLDAAIAVGGHVTYIEV